jgi:hypothetical protein
MTKKNIWVIEQVNKGTVGLYGHYYIRKETGDILYMARKKDRSSGIHHQTNSISVDLKTLNEAKARGVKAIVIAFTKSKDKFITNISQFFEEGVVNFDLGDNAQQIRLSVPKFIERKSVKL